MTQMQIPKNKFDNFLQIIFNNFHICILSFYLNFRKKWCFFVFQIFSSSFCWIPQFFQSIRRILRRLRNSHPHNSHNSQDLNTTFLIIHNLRLIQLILCRMNSTPLISHHRNLHRDFPIHVILSIWWYEVIMLCMTLKCCRTDSYFWVANIFYTHNANPE
jgi:hypothetical protein